MATESSNGFRHAISFQSGDVNFTSQMIPMGSCFGVSTSTTGLVLPGNSGMNVLNAASGLLQASNFSTFPLDSVPGFRRFAGLVVEWSSEEQRKLEEGLEKFEDEPSIMKYIKIAATLPEKTVRDVVLRCRWTARKRRKGEEHKKKLTNRKDKLVESSPKLSMPSDLTEHSAIYTPFMHHLGQNTSMPCEGLSGTTSHLLQQNAQAFCEISSNLSICKLQENIDLFCRTRNNITAILNNMSQMPGIMSQMPPLPVSFKEDLVDSIMPGATQQEPRNW